MVITAGLVGCGRMGRRHVEVISQLGIRLLTIADPIDSACQYIVEGWQGPNPPAKFSDIDQLLRHSVPDLLVIATTADMHADQALQAIEAGVKLILLEKPVVTSLRQSVALQKVSTQKGARIAVNHQMRFLPQYTIPKNLLFSDAYGGFKSMHVAAGNFGLAMNGTHYFEAFRFLSSEGPLSISAWFDSESLPNPRGLQFQDVSGSIRVITASGHRLYLDASADQGHGMQVTYMARNGRITVDELTGVMKSVVRVAENREAPTSRYGMPFEISDQQIPAVELVESTKGVLKALLAGENYPTLADATFAVKTLVAAYHSHRQGGAVVHLADVADDDLEVFPWA